MPLTAGDLYIWWLIVSFNVKDFWKYAWRRRKYTKVWDTWCVVAILKDVRMEGANWVAAMLRVKTTGRININRVFQQGSKQSLTFRYSATPKWRGKYSPEESVLFAKTVYIGAAWQTSEKARVRDSVWNVLCGRTGALAVIIRIVQCSE